VLGVGEKFPRFSLIANVGARQETAFISLTDQDFRNAWKLYFFWAKDFTPLALTELIAFAALDYELSELQTRCVGASVESEYAHLAWRRQEPELRDYPFPLLADTKRELCGELGILNDRDGVAERATFIVDPEDVIQFVYVLGMVVPRDAGEVLRVLASLQGERKS
jgi:peroxiredoxin (alkyl hydroperoxide reductase subunit C)